MGRIGSNCVDGRAHDYDGLRFGMFDWIVGWASHTWPAVPQCQVCLHSLGSWWGPCNVAASTCTGLLANRAWRRSFSGMWLRGLVWWVPPSVAMRAAGHGHALALASVSFPLVYELGSRLQIATNAPEHWKWATGGFISYSEFLFGAYIWLIITASLLGTSNGCETDGAFPDRDVEAARATRVIAQTVAGGSLQATGGKALGVASGGNISSRRDEASLGSRLLESRPESTSRVGSELRHNSSASSILPAQCSVGAWLRDALSLGPLPESADVCGAQHGCRWVLRALNLFHLALSLATMVLLMVTIAENRFGMCEDC